MFLEKSHVFKPSVSNVIICEVCKKDITAHWKPGTCEACGAEENVTMVYGNMYMCRECQRKESEAYAANMTPEKQQERLDAHNNRMNAALEASRSIDNSIEVRTDLFNASTVAIIELKKIIDADETITNKPYAFAEELISRFNKHKQVIFEQTEDNIKRGNEQKAIQVYLNNLSNQLRAEEREKLKIADINYKPTPPKSTTPKPIRTAGTSKKFDKAEVKRVAAELTKELNKPVSEFLLQQIAIQKSCSAVEAGQFIKKMMATITTENA